jgi:hypothetical protein
LPLEGSFSARGKEAIAAGGLQAFAHPDGLFARRITDTYTIVDAPLAKIGALNIRRPIAENARVSALEFAKRLKRGRFGALGRNLD